MIDKLFNATFRIVPKKITNQYRRNCFVSRFITFNLVTIIFLVIELVRYGHPGLSYIEVVVCAPIVGYVIALLCNPITPKLDNNKKKLPIR